METKTSFKQIAVTFLGAIFSVILGFFVVYGIIILSAWVDFPQADDLALPLFITLPVVAGIFFIWLAKKKFGSSWKVGVSGILGFVCGYVGMFIIFGLLYTGSGNRNQHYDIKLITYIEQARTALAVYFDDHGEYPSSLDKLYSDDFNPSSLEDPMIKQSTIYVSFNKGSNYHLGATLDKDTPSLKTDHDCNSISGDNCPFNISDGKSGFNGADRNGCRGEAGQFCYDVAD